MVDLYKKLELKYPRALEIIRFLIIGGIATVIDLFVMSLVIYLPYKEAFGGRFLSVFLNQSIAPGWIVALGSAVGFVVGLIFNYVFSLNFVYKGENVYAKTKKGFTIFTVLSAIGLAIETLGVYVGYELFHINEWIVKVVLILLVLIFNYITRKKFIFTENKKTPVVGTNKDIKFTEQEKRMMEYVCFIALFVVYLVLAIVSMVFIPSIDMQFIFGSDSPRVLRDWSVLDADHYRTKVHPLYVLLIYPIVNTLTILGANSTFAVVLMLSVISTINTWLLYSIFKKICNGKFQFIAVVLAVFYAFSFSQLENLMVIESFTFGTFTLLLFWHFYVHKFKEGINTKKDVLLAIVLGMLTFSMVLTNYGHFLIGLAFLVVLNKKKNVKDFFKDVAKYALIVLGSIAVSFVLIKIQGFLFKSSESALKYIISVIKDLLTGGSKSEDVSYIKFGVTGTAFYNILLFFFGFAFVGGNVYVTDIIGLTLAPNAITWIVIATLIVALGYSVYKLIKNKQYFMLAVALAYVYEMLLHLFYGNDELMLYIIQSSFLLLMIIMAGLSTAKGKEKTIVTSISVGLLLLSLINVAMGMLKMLFFIKEKYGFDLQNIIGNNLRFFAIIALMAAVVFVVVLLLSNSKRNNSYKKDCSISRVIIAVVLIITILFGMVTRSTNTNNNTTIYVERENVANQNKDSYNILMGMGQRQKYVFEINEDDANFYKYTIDGKKKEVLLNNLNNVSYDAENYTITCKDASANAITIYENSQGIYLKKNANLIPLDESQTINIPDFSSYSQSRYLKILFYEVMVNVLPNGFTPNYLTYGNFWYRDGAIVSMVLEKTGNVDQMRLNVTKENVYDGARGGVDEPDNLGELLYMLSLQETTNWEVVNAVLDEAERIKQDDNCIHGLTDFAELYVYQTTWLKFGMESLGLDSSAYDIEGKVDDYSTFCWWYKTDSPENYPLNVEEVGTNLLDITKTPYPYLEIARLHYYKVKVDLPEISTYPISYEWQDWGLPACAECAPHSWTAAELFLYLLDYDTF